MRCHCWVFHRKRCCHHPHMPHRPWEGLPPGQMHPSLWLPATLRHWVWFAHTPFHLFVLLFGYFFFLPRLLYLFLCFCYFGFCVVICLEFGVSVFFYFSLLCVCVCVCVIGVAVCLFLSFILFFFFLIFVFWFAYLFPCFSYFTHPSLFYLNFYHIYIYIYIYIFFFSLFPLRACWLLVHWKRSGLCLWDGSTE